MDGSAYVTDAGSRSSVRKNPGLTMVVVMPNGATSCCRHSVGAVGDVQLEDQQVARPSHGLGHGVAVPAGGHDRVACGQGGLDEINAHATAGTSYEPDLLVRHGISFAPDWFINTLYDPASWCPSLTFSIQSTALPLSCSCMAMCVMAVVAAAPCQCFSPGGI